ncbi:hypothetical protein mRhiFer1_009695 [Rhinolophus ferrumequinum]|uniref:Uncharacterized protein n=1 Tax=Rhinolophus ferrumequinum TaxID=59479 RepID=A0A7J7R0Q6_RHIFE|nr:hypothetical protein mRhiFer1_009695 [Rhinolophus ferrumequinum]
MPGRGGSSGQQLAGWPGTAERSIVRSVPPLPPHLGHIPGLQSHGPVALTTSSRACGLLMSSLPQGQMTSAAQIGAGLGVPLGRPLLEDRNSFISAQYGCVAGKGVEIQASPLAHLPVPTCLCQVVGLGDWARSPRWLWPAQRLKGQEGGCLSCPEGGATGPAAAGAGQW